MMGMLFDEFNAPYYDSFLKAWNKTYFEKMATISKGNKGKKNKSLKSRANRRKAERKK